MSLVVSFLPKSGLGNKLFIWSYGVVFSKKNNLPHITLNLLNIHFGAILRNEKSKRFYWGYMSMSYTMRSLLMYIQNYFTRKKVCLSPDECQLKVDLSKKYMYVFNILPYHKDYFSAIKNSRELIRSSFSKYFRSNYLKRSFQISQDSIAVHIRRGDFKFNSSLIFDNEYYIKQINLLRKLNGIMPVFIFTDSEENELKDFLELPMVNIVNGNKDIDDLIQISLFSSIIITPTSTFSLWAAFLSDASVYYEFKMPRIRLESNLYEGSVENDNF